MPDRTPERQEQLPAPAYPGGPAFPDWVECYECKRRVVVNGDNAEPISIRSNGTVACCDCDLPAAPRPSPQDPTVQDSTPLEIPPQCPFCKVDAVCDRVSAQSTGWLCPKCKTWTANVPHPKPDPSEHREPVGQSGQSLSDWLQEWARLRPGQDAVNFLRCAAWIEKAKAAGVTEFDGHERVCPISGSPLPPEADDA